MWGSTLKTLSQGSLDEFLALLSRDREVFALEAADGQYHLSRASVWQPGTHTLGAYRSVEPLKSLVFRPREFLGALSDDAAPPAMPERIVIGVKNCDLSALKVHDHVFRDTEPVDPYYAEARAKTVLVACDCTDARDVCFCPAVKEQPYATGGFDINLSPVGDAILVEAGTPKGEALLKDAGAMLSAADDALVQARDRQREQLTARLRTQAETHGLPADADLQAAVRKTAESELWDGFAQDCVECGACNLICCTCHCFLLADGLTENEQAARVKQWDSCLYRNFATVAGGANPRGHRAERLDNRFDKKFAFFPAILGMYACDGCGRCIEACTGKIDIREVLKKALDESESL